MKIPADGIQDISHKQFFSFSVEEFGEWLTIHLSIWAEHPYAHNLFTPRPSIGQGRGGDIFNDLVVFEKDFPLAVATDFRRGLKQALDNALIQQDLKLAEVLIHFANKLGYREVQNVSFTQAYVKSIHKYFHNYLSYGSIVELLLQSVAKDLTTRYTKQLLVHLDIMTSLYGRTKVCQEKNVTLFQVSMELFLRRILVEREDDIELITWQFIERINMCILSDPAFEEELLEYNIHLLMEYLTTAQIQLAHKAVVRWQQDNGNNAMWLYKSIADVM